MTRRAVHRPVLSGPREALGAGVSSLHELLNRLSLLADRAAEASSDARGLPQGDHPFEPDAHLLGDVLVGRARDVPERLSRR
jgi:hypothetical protein